MDRYQPPILKIMDSLKIKARELETGKIVYFDLINDENLSWFGDCVAGKFNQWKWDISLCDDNDWPGSREP